MGVVELQRKCSKCKCRTCLNSCCDKKNCTCIRESCKYYIGFRQLSIFDLQERKNNQSAPRYSWAYYGLGNKEYRKNLRKICMSGRYDKIIRKAAYKANQDIALHLIKSVTMDKSYEQIEFDMELGRICVGKSDFYGYRRFFYSLLDRELRRAEK